MRILVISASMRENSQSIKVARYLHQRIEANNVQSGVLDLNQLDLPIFKDDNVDQEKKTELNTNLDSADGYVFVSPEWNGMMSHGLVNMFHYVEHQMAHKPVMLVGVSSGRGGHYPMMQMRIMGYKNNHFVISPENLYVNKVKEVFNNQNFDEESEDYQLKMRADYSLKILVEYAKSLKNVRDSGILGFVNFKNGV